MKKVFSLMLLLATFMVNLIAIGFFDEVGIVCLGLVESEGEVLNTVLGA